MLYPEFKYNISTKMYGKINGRACFYHKATPLVINYPYPFKTSFPIAPGVYISHGGWLHQGGSLLPTFGITPKSIPEVYQK